jgi:hypothetical protein
VKSRIVAKIFTIECAQDVVPVFRGSRADHDPAVTRGIRVERREPHQPVSLSEWHPKPLVAIQRFVEHQREQRLDQRDIHQLTTSCALTRVECGQDARDRVRARYAIRER